MDWQLIETAPKDGTRFWAYEKGHTPQRYECWWQKDIATWDGWQDDWDNDPAPTHWMPLPPPPTQATCNRCGEAEESEHLNIHGNCPTCADDMGQ